MTALVLGGVLSATVWALRHELVIVRAITGRTRVLSAAEETRVRKPAAVRRVTDPLAAVALRQHSTPVVGFEHYTHMQDIGDLMQQGHSFGGGGDKKDKEAC